MDEFNHLNRINSAITASRKSTSEFPVATGLFIKDIDAILDEIRSYSTNIMAEQTQTSSSTAFVQYHSRGSYRELSDAKAQMRLQTIKAFSASDRKYQSGMVSVHYELAEV